MEKICTKCKALKDASLFSRQKETKDGLKSWCKACNVKAASLYQKLHPDKRKELNDRYYKKNRENILYKNRKRDALNRDKKREADRIYSRSHKEQANKRASEWYEKNKERVKETSRIYREKNKDVIKNRKSLYSKTHRLERNAIQNARRAKKKGNGGKYTKQEFTNLCNRLGNICLCCKRSDVKLTVDHVVPISKGGSNDISNIQPLCISCNSRKHDSIIDYR